MCCSFLAGARPGERGTRSSSPNLYCYYYYYYYSYYYYYYYYYYYLLVDSRTSEPRHMGILRFRGSSIPGFPILHILY